MVRGSPYPAGHTGCWNRIPNDSSALDISLGRMASFLDPTLCRGANDLAVHCVAATLLVQVDRSEPLTVDCGGNSRGGCIYARQLGTGALGARTIAIVATRKLLPCCNYLAALRSAWGESSGSDGYWNHAVCRNNNSTLLRARRHRIDLRLHRHLPL